ncbi:uncharacterized protein LOC106082241 [Stomoxys calcitrans]|uniref:Uncharacterized protein n=1 Tax=Stomoxys calcitrans TaxID=35570 RepID=A0A1I8PZQ6_STOCA|nr:uncharacterized protein LOC106082241 [Stomoxys calcitrans]
MTQKIILIYALVISWNPKTRLNARASLDTTWENSVTADTEVEAEAMALNVNKGNNGLWHQAAQPKDWWLKTSGRAQSSTMPSESSKPWGEAPTFAHMAKDQVQLYNNMAANRFLIHNNGKGNYTKKQITPLAASVTAPAEYYRASSSASTSYVNNLPHVSLKLKPYELTSVGDANTEDNLIDIERQRRRRRPNNPSQRHAWMDRNITPYVAKDKAIIAPNQVESHMTHTLETHGNRQHYRNDLMSPVPHDSRLFPLPQGVVSQNDLSVNNVNFEDDVTSTHTTSYAAHDIETNDENLNKMLRPIHQALDRVKQFCDIVKDMLTTDSGNDDDDDDGYDDVDNEIDSYENKIVGDDKTTTDKELLQNQDGKYGNDHSNLSLSLLTNLKMLLRRQPAMVDEGQGQVEHKENNKSPPTTSPLETGREGETITPRILEAIQPQWHDVFAETLGVRRAPSSPLVGSERKVKKKIKKKFKKFLLPLLLAYKLKFLTLIPLLIGGLTLLVGSTGLAGFFFALFAAVMTMKGGHGYRSSS